MAKTKFNFLSWDDFPVEEGTMEDYLLYKARCVASQAHQGQMRINGDDYINHPMRVAEMCSGTQAKTVAWLHDVIEDCDVDYNFICLEFGLDIVQAVDALSRRENEDYALVYLPRLMQNRLALHVKLADLHDNLDVTSLKVIDDNDIKRIRKHHAAYLRVKSFIKTGVDPLLAEAK